MAEQLISTETLATSKCKSYAREEKLKVSTFYYENEGHPVLFVHVGLMSMDDVFKVDLLFIWCHVLSHWLASHVHSLKTHSVQ